MVFSKSSSTEAKEAGERRSYPAANTWQVSRQTPIRDLSFTSAIISRRSEKVDPITLPAPAMVSSTGVMVVVEACAALRWDAILAMAAGRGEEPVEPGL